jgi:hypothetical protein
MNINIKLAGAVQQVWAPRAALGAKGVVGNTLNRDAWALFSMPHIVLVLGAGNGAQSPI